MIMSPVKRTAWVPPVKRDIKMPILNRKTAMIATKRMAEMEPEK